MDFKLKDKLYLPGLKPQTKRDIKNRITLKNPAYIEAKKMGRYTDGIEPELKFYEETQEELKNSKQIKGAKFLHYLKRDPKKILASKLEKT